MQIGMENYTRSTISRVSGSNRRLFNRRGVIGLIIGILLGFNLASWIAIPTPNQTDIEIVITQNDVSKQFLIDSARIRHRKSDGKLKKDCNHEIISYGDSNNDPKKQDFENDFSDEKVEIDSDFKNEFDIHEERLKRQKQLELFYESDLEPMQGENNFDSFKEPNILNDNPNYPDTNLDFENLEQDENIDANKEERGNYRRKNIQLSLKLENRNILPHIDKDSNIDPKKFLYVGVLTAKKYISTRGKAIMDTWGPDVPGDIEFYVGEGVKVSSEEIPIVRLPGVQDDVYPPQKKSFLLLKRMHDAYLNSGYQWFMRADDDAYIKTDELEKFLRKLNSSEPIFLGQTGLGNEEERGRLSLNHGENYCMGGPGMIFSREVLRLVGPNIQDCVHHLYSWHEDVELSRCVRRFANVNCAWSYEVQSLFYEHYSLRKGYIDPYIDSYNPRLHTALTLHPNKNPAYQIKLHKFMRERKIKKQLERIKMLSRDIVAVDKSLERTSTADDYMAGVFPSLQRFVPRTRREVLGWEYITDRVVYSFPPNPIRRSISADRQLAHRLIIAQVMRKMNTNSKVRGRLIDFKQISYGYRRINPLFGVDYVLDLLLIYKRFRGKKMTIPVRRHAYIQQTFSQPNLYEPFPLNIKDIRTLIYRSRSGFFSSLLNSIWKGSNSIFKKSTNSISDQNKSDNSTQQLVRFDSGKFTSYEKDVLNSDVTVIHIIVPLVGRHETFCSFMLNLEKVSLSQNDPISLLVILFMGENEHVKNEAHLTQQVLNNYAAKYPSYDLRLIMMEAKFSRGLALEMGASHFTNDSLLFFCDIDVVFKEEFLRKCRSNTVKGHQVFYPILFSEYHPDNLSSMKYTDNLDAAIDRLQNNTYVRQLQKAKNHYVIGEKNGYWRSYGYGLLCVYQEDFTATGGFDISIEGWGLEDVDLVDKFVTGSRHKLAPRRQVDITSIQIMRTFEPSLVHVYHPSLCDNALADNQFQMCLRSRASGLAATSNLSPHWFERSKNSPKQGSLNDPVSRIIPVLHQLKSKNNLAAEDTDLNKPISKIKHNIVD